MRFQNLLSDANMTKQPPTVPERLKEGRYLRLKVGVMDAEGRGDQNALGLSLIRQVEEKICTNNCYWICCKGTPLDVLWIGRMMVWY